MKKIKRKKEAGFIYIYFPNVTEIKKENNLLGNATTASRGDGVKVMCDSL
jgi:hypothetical protein